MSRKLHQYPVKKKKKKIDKLEAYILAMERIERNQKEIKDGELSDLVVFEMLVKHYVYKQPKEDIVKSYTPAGGDPSFIRRILSRKTGVDTSRKNGVRETFRQYMIRIGLGDPFVEYKTPESKRKKPMEPKFKQKGFGLTG